MQHLVGTLIDESGGKPVRYQLKTGVNFIGRKSPSTPPDVNIQIATTDATIHRKHCKIYVEFFIDIEKKISKMEHILSDCKGGNPVWVYNQKRKRIQVFQEDEVYMEQHYILQLGNTELRLEVPIPDIPTT